MMVDSVQQVTTGLIRALTDDGMLGTATGDLLAAQHARAGYIAFCIYIYMHSGSQKYLPTLQAVSATPSLVQSG